MKYKMNSFLHSHLIEVLVDESHERLLDDQQLVRGVVEQSVEGISLTPHTHVVVEPGELLRDDPVGEDALPLGDDHHVHHHVLREPDGGPEVPGKGHQQMEDGDDVLGMNRLDTPPRLVPLEAEDPVGHAQDDLQLVLLPLLGLGDLGYRQRLPSQLLQQFLEDLRNIYNENLAVFCIYLGSLKSFQRVPNQTVSK